MKVFRLKINYAMQGGTLLYFATHEEAEQAHAVAASSEEGDREEFWSIDFVECRLTKAGILDFLNNHTPYHDNG